MKVRIIDVGKVLGAMKKLFSCRAMAMNVKRRLFEGAVLYAAETLSMGVPERKRLKVMKMRCLRNMCGVTRMDQVRNEVVQRGTGITRELAG